MSRHSLFLTIAIASYGCSASVANVQPAQTTPEGDFRLVGAVTATPPVGLPGVILDTLEEVGADTVDEDPTLAELDEIGRVTIAAAAQPPSIDGQLALSYGVTDAFEIGVRVGPVNAGGGFRIRWLETKNDFYGSFGFRTLISFNDFPVERFTNEVQLDRYRRFDFAFPLLLGYSSRVMHLWAGPQFMIARFDAELDVCLDSEACLQEVEIRTDGRITYITGQMGIALGRKPFWIAAEMNISRIHVYADLGLSMEDTSVLARRLATGRVYTPSLGFIAQF